MGNCTSKSNPATEGVVPPPHPQARKIWLIAVPLDSQQIPLDLCGIDAGGLKAAMKNRGLETEHWALKVDPAAGEKASAQVFDISVQSDKMVSSVTDSSSPFWRNICRRLDLGWTIWNDAEIAHATKMLLQARPKYDGRTNNLQQLAQILARHIQYTPPKAESTAEVASSSQSMLKPSVPPSSQNTEPSQQRTSSVESNDPSIVARPPATPGTEFTAANPTSTPSVSTRHSSQRLSRPPLIHFHGSEGEASDLSDRPPLHRASASDQPSARVQSGRRGSALVRSPLNPDSERPTVPRSRTRSDASQAAMGVPGHPREPSQEDRRRSTFSNQTPHRRRSQVPAEWATESKRNGNRHSVMGSSALGGDYTGSVGRPSRRDSQANFAPLPPPLPHSSTWNPAFGPPTPPMLQMPLMSPYDMSAGMSPFMPGYGMTASSSMGGYHQQPMLPRPMSLYGANMGMPWMQPQMPMLVPPSPGYNASMHSSMVPTPPESPLPPFDQLPKQQYQQPSQQQQQQQQQQRQ